MAKIKLERKAGVPFWLEQVIYDVADAAVESIKPNYETLLITFDVEFSPVEERASGLPTIFALMGRAPEEQPWRGKLNLSLKMFNLQISPQNILRYQFSLEEIVGGIAHEISESELLFSSEYDNFLFGARTEPLDDLVYLAVRDRLADTIAAERGYERELFAELPRTVKGWKKLLIFPTGVSPKLLMFFMTDKSISLRNAGFLELAEKWWAWGNTKLQTLRKDELLVDYENMRERIVKKGLSFITLWEEIEEARHKDKVHETVIPLAMAPKNITCSICSSGKSAHWFKEIGTGMIFCLSCCSARFPEISRAVKEMDLSGTVIS